ncbi:Eukaryotic aspartyl protease family protein [Rhynchospora pubera]|uniref:Eukaryotic aspartyl protease family protein n=1 Tax=Rhynchospora pubera TaxID=906938 RepID=A0AAV8EVG4_9POAL|nr:Eukaryotic aspartyl protease family protein [Rhynchospora pubera]
MQKLIPLLFPFFLLTSSLQLQQFTHLTLTPQSVHQNQVTNQSNFSLPIYHISSFSNHTNNTSTFGDRIHRDSARVASLAHDLSLPLDRYKLTDFGSDVVSGLSQGSGEYFIRVGVGTPAREQYLVIDSGSDVIWLQCIPCDQCYSQSDAIFDPSTSASFSAVTCGSRVCHLVSGTNCGSSDESCGYMYEVSYRDGSYSKGVVALETLTFGSTAVSGVAIGCGHRNHGLFTGAAGLLGLGWGPTSFLTQLGGSAGGVFSYCLASRGSSSEAGSLIFGRTEGVPVGAVWVPLLHNPRAPSFYYVGLLGLGVAGVRLPLEEDMFQLSEDGYGGVVMDTGTAVTRLPQQAYSTLRDGFIAAAVGLPRTSGVSIFDTCYDLNGYSSVRVPTVSFYFTEGAILTLPARNFLIPVDSSGTFCFAFAPSPTGLSIMGNIQQEGIQITFDVANGFVGFGPNTC